MTRRTVRWAPPLDRAYFFDIDGTLSELAATPSEARVDEALRRNLVGLHDETGGAVAIVTGRSLGVVDEMFPGLGIAVAAQHGRERRRADGVVVHRAFDQRVMDRVRGEVGAALASYEQLLVEDKGAAVAIHYRAKPTLASAVHRIARRVTRELGPVVVMLRGKRVVELALAGQDKGQAVRAFLAEPPFNGRRPVFVGDDITDEAAFAEVNRLGGDSIKVGPGSSIAQWRLRAVEDVRAWLESRE